MNPGLEIRGEAVVFHGYQEYVATKRGLLVLPEDCSLQRKRQLLAPFFHPRYLAEREVLDVGAQGGFFCFWALQAGASRAVALEMDKQYVTMLEQARSHLGLSKLRVVCGTVGSWAQPADVVVALGLVQGTSSYTESFVDLDALVEHLAGLTRYMLIVEWIDPADPAIQLMDHLHRNPRLERGPHDREAFERSLAAHFERFQVIGDVGETRSLYVAWRTSHEIDLSGPLPVLWPRERILSRRRLTTCEGIEYWSCVWDGGDRIYKQATLDLAAREADFLAMLDGPHFPRVLEKKTGPGYSIVVLERVQGSPLLRGIEGVRDDRRRFLRFVLGCLRILKELKAAGIVHRDIRPDNILLRDGLPVLIDFGWAVASSHPYVTPACLGASERPPDGAFCDVYSMGKVLEIAKGAMYPELDSVIRLMTANDGALRVTDPDVLELLVRVVFHGRRSRRGGLL
jgi:hypothetical protein